MGGLRTCVFKFMAVSGMNWAFEFLAFQARSLLKRSVSRLPCDSSVGAPIHRSPTFYEAPRLNVALRYVHRLRSSEPCIREHAYTYIYTYTYIYIYTHMSDGFYSKSLILCFNVRFLISFASLRIFDVIFEVLTDLVQFNPSFYKKEVWYIMCIDLVPCSVPISFARESDLRTPKQGTM